MRLERRILIIPAAITLVIAIVTEGLSSDDFSAGVLVIFACVAASWLLNRISRRGRSDEPIETWRARLRLGEGVTPARLAILAATVPAAAIVGARAGGAPGAGAALVAWCMATLAFWTHRDHPNRARSNERGPSGRRKLAMAVQSAVFGAAVVGLSDLAFMLAFHGYARVVDQVFVRGHHGFSETPLNRAVGTVLGTALALRIATDLSRSFGPKRKPGERRRSDLKIVALTLLVAATWGAGELRARYRFCRRMAESPAAPRRWPDTARDPAVHAWLARWYEHAAPRPWLPIHPDHTNPERQSILSYESMN